LCYERLATTTIGYPNLAKHQAEPFTQSWREFDNHWPWTVPLRLLMYTNNYNVVTVDTEFQRAWYPVGIGWFDFEFDYFSVMSTITHTKLKQGLIKVLFYYHEGDNPYRIKHQLTVLTERHQLPRDCYVFISANTKAADIKQFLYFPDHEFFFRCVNRHQLPDNSDRTFNADFTVINRLNKWWRASVMSDLQFHGLLETAIWSYNTAGGDITESENDNPIMIDVVPGWRERTRAMTKTQTFCDGLTSQQQNDHHYVNNELYRVSRCSLVLETHFDVDQSHGAFLTEKTFKPIKYGQPFVIIGGPGSLQALRDSGYRVFDHVLDNRYDTIVDNTERYFAIRNTVDTATTNKSLYAMCREDIIHNQLIFNERAHTPVNTLIKDIQCR
jgi:hypothetical protein